jgi:hypothetical protein
VAYFPFSAAWVTARKAFPSSPGVLLEERGPEFLEPGWRVVERRTGAGRRYTLTYRATDGSGKATTKSATVTVPLNR